VFLPGFHLIDAERRIEYDEELRRILQRLPASGLTGVSWRFRGMLPEAIEVKK
jgi:hypothetical protein